jgi:hypothetical protein
MPRLGPCALLLVATLAAYAPLRNAAFVNYDDPLYVTANPIVQRGLTLDGVAWAFRADEGSIWHPLTWLSHMTVVSLGGLDPRWHHLTSLALHAANAVILLLVLAGATGEPWPSTLAALLFAVHPLHVESVAWVAERKDVLSTLFALLAIGAYARRVARGRAPGLPVALLFACSLMAKPTLVTLPLLLLLLDWWPLTRVPGLGRVTLRALLVEKIPLALLAAAASVVAVVTQSKESTTSLATLPVVDRVAHALLTYVTYLRLAVWPAGLAVFYPYPHAVDRAAAAGAAALLLVITAAAVAVRRSAPYVLVGWGWFLISLLPVIGVVQIGLQAYADRYAYVPLIGLAITLAFALAAAARALPRARLPIVAASAVAVAACILVTWRQVGYWHDDMTLYRRALAVTSDNFVAHNNLGLALMARGGAAHVGPERSEARAHFEEAIRLRPAYPEAHNNLGGVLYLEGRRQEAVAQFTEALRLRPGFAEARDNLRLAAGASETP